MGFGETITANQISQEIWNFARHLMSEFSLVGNWQLEKRQKKSGLRRKLKVSTLDIQIKQSGLKLSKSKISVPVPIKSLMIWFIPHQSKVFSPVLGYLSNLFVLLYKRVYTFSGCYWMFLWDPPFKVVVRFWLGFSRYFLSRSKFFKVKMRNFLKNFLF